MTRGAAAKIICNLLLGPTTAGALSADAAPYSDVPADSTFAGYIAYCQKEGIISGYADGTFRPANSLTGYAFMKMLLGALGYKADVEGYTGANWSINVAKQAINAGLNAGLVADFNGVNAVTREEACLYAFNTLQATMVEYDTTITIGGVTVAGARSDVANTGKETIENDDKMQFAEKYFTKLVKNPTTDDFGRPATEWTYDKESVGTFVDYTCLVEEFTTKVTYKDLYETIGSSNLKKNDYVAYIDGVPATGKDATVTSWTKSDKNTFASTGNGVLTQVFVDTDNDLITVAVINTYLAKATADYSAKNDKVTFEVFGVKTSNNEYVKDAGKDGSSKTGVVVYGEDIAAVTELEKDDIVLVTLANKEVQTVSDIETVAGVEITNFKQGDYLTADGTKYDYASTATYKKDVLDQYDQSNMKDTTYNVYLDEYGYLLGVEIVDEVKNFVFITGYESFKKVLSNATTEANAIFLDGTTATITVNVDDDLKGSDGKAWDNENGEPLENAWYSYSVDKKGNYDLEIVPTTGSDERQDHDNSTNGKEIDKSHVSLKGSNQIAYGNEETVYLTAKVKTINSAKQITKAESVVIGVKNASFKLTVEDNAPSGAYYLYDEDLYIIAAVVVGKNNATSDNYVFATSTVNYEGYDKTADEYTWTVEGIRDGEKVVLTEVGSKQEYLDAVKAKTFYKFSYDANGYVVDEPETITWDEKNDLDGDTYAVKFVDVFNSTAAGYDKNDVELVYHRTTAGLNTLTMTGHTLYFYNSKTADYSLDIAPDAKAVLIYTMDGKEYTEYFDSASGNVKAAIDELESTSFNGNIFAVMDDGVVTSIIIIDETKHTGTSVEGNGNVSTTVTGVSASYDNGTLTVTLTGAGSDDENTVVLYQLVDGVQFKVATYTVEGTSDTFTVTLGVGTYGVNCGNLGSTFKVA